MTEFSTLAAKRLFAAIGEEVTESVLPTYRELILAVESESEERARADMKDEEAERRFLQPINPDPVRAFAQSERAVSKVRSA